MLNKILPDYQAIHASYVAFAQECSAASSVIKEDARGFFHKELWHTAAERLLHGLPVSKEFGGNGFSAMQTCAAFEGFAMGCKNNGLTFSIAAHAMACVMPLYLFGSDEQKKGLLHLWAGGKAIAANAITEANAGSDVFAMETVAERQGDNYIINGAKVYITNAPVADYILLYCLTDANKGFFGGVSAFILPAQLNGITLSSAKEKMGLRTCPMGFINLQNTLVNADNMLGKEGSGAVIFNTSMVWEKTIMSSINLGQLERVFEATVAYCRERKIKNRPLIDYTNIGHALADVQIVINAARGLVYDAASAIDSHDKNALQKASIAKCFVAEHAVHAIQKMQGMYGALGYLTDTEIEREYRDIYAALIYSGTTDIQKNIIISNVR